MKTKFQVNRPQRNVAKPYLLRGRRKRKRKQKKEDAEEEEGRRNLAKKKICLLPWAIDIGNFPCV